MFALGKDFARVTHYFRNLRGGSQPILAQASDGLLYVVKFTNNLQGANLPFNESIGNELYHACGLPVPAWKPLLVTDAFLDQYPDCWMQTAEGHLRPASGLCFGSLYLGGDGVRLLEILPGTSFKRVCNREDFWLAWLIDICAQHSDNRQALFQENADGRLQAFFVDHGHLFGGPKGEQKPNFQASRYLDPRVYQGVSSHYIPSFQKIAGALKVDQLWRGIQELPDGWKTESALHGFEQCLHRLSDARLLQNIFDSMADAQNRFNERSNNQNGPVLQRAVQCFGVSTTRGEQQFATSDSRYPACA